MNTTPNPNYIASCQNTGFDFRTFGESVSFDLPQDIYVHYLFPSLPLSKVIELTEMKPSLLPKAKKHILNVGKWIGMNNVSDAREVLCKMQINTAPEMIFTLFKNFFTEDILAFVCSWVDPYTYNRMDKEDILETWGEILEEISHVFVNDLNACIDYVFRKPIIMPYVYKYEKEFGYKNLFQFLFPNFFPLFYDRLTEFLTTYPFSDQFNTNTFLNSENLNPVIQSNTEYNASRILHSWIFQ